MGLALLFTLLSAALNASWNVLLKAAEDPLRTATRAVLLSVVVITPCCAIGWLIVGRPAMPARAALIAALSGLVELAYFVSLSAAYRRGELSAVYPLARGTAPLLAVLAGVILLHERPGPVAGAGILLLLAGIWIARRPRANRDALAPALLTGVCIATYSALDSEGIHLTAAPWLYGWVLWSCTAAWLLAWAAVGRLARMRRPAPVAAGPTQGLDRGAEPEDGPPGSAGILPAWGAAQGGQGENAPTIFRACGPPSRSSAGAVRPLIIGVLMTASYWLVLLALRVAPLAVVAPLRESSIVLVAGWGIWRLEERRGLRLRIAGVAAILCGAVLLAL